MKEERKIPITTYRLQLNRNFTFCQAEQIIDYINQLGISHCYLSPFLKARPGSMHGYDIIDHNRFNTEIGSHEDFERLTSKLKDYNMGILLDIVPNHMGVGTDNAWWMDVLENGPASPYAEYFDITWQSIYKRLNGKVLLPVLSGLYGDMLKSGKIKLIFNNIEGKFFINIDKENLPVNPSSYPLILAERLNELKEQLGGENDLFIQFEHLIQIFESLPAHTAKDSAEKALRIKRKDAGYRILAQLCKQSDILKDFINTNLKLFDCSGSEKENLNRLHELLESQAYRISNWRVSADIINYRRFFNINDLAGVRIERPEVFESTHNFILDLIKDNKIDGVRIDHIDGLYDPTDYLNRLQRKTAERKKILFNNKMQPEILPLYIIVEKILAPFEKLHEEWPVAGTTGYEFAFYSGGLFVNSENEKKLTRIYSRFISKKYDLEKLYYESKQLIMRSVMSGELNVLAHMLIEISENNWETRDFTLNNLREALRIVIACFPVYRTYISGKDISKKDTEYIEWAVNAAKKKSSTLSPAIFDFIKSVLLLDTGVNGSIKVIRDFLNFTMKFQQYTAPVMAKGLEDTAFYIYNRLVSLNEVGSDPHKFGVSVSAFHYWNSERNKEQPYGLLTTSTHDTKRSEDVRARINVISEIPEKWQKYIFRWSRMNYSKKTMIENRLVPGRNEEYLFYESLLGIWTPDIQSEDDLSALRERLSKYMIKSAREAKVYTSWLTPDKEYEDALINFINGVLSRLEKNPFIEKFLTLWSEISQFGYFNSLSQTALKLTSPGIPDFYQGTEILNFTLTDPDNRQQIDYEKMRWLLNEVYPFTCEDRSCDERIGFLKYLMRNMYDDRLKLFVVTAGCNLRKRKPDIFWKGEYIPIESSGEKENNIVAFVREYNGLRIMTVVPRLIVSLISEDYKFPLGSGVWKDTRVEIDKVWQGHHWKNCLTGEWVKVYDDGETKYLNVADILLNFPVAILEEII